MADPACLPNASLLVCSRNRPEFLSAVVASILSGDALPTELLVVDQSDTPNKELASLEAKKPCAIRYLWSRSVGLSRASNIGTRAAHHDRLVFTHDDVLVSSHWYAALLTALVRAGPRAVVFGQVKSGEAELPGGFVSIVTDDERPMTYAGRIGADVLFPLNMAMHRSALLEVGGFDERLGPGTPLPGAEDNDLGFRLLEAG